MGLLTLIGAGGGFILIGAWESLTASIPPSDQLNPSTVEKSTRSISFSSTSFIATAALALLFVMNSLISFLDAVNSNDEVGSALQLQSVAVSSLFLLYSVIGLLLNFTASLPLPPKLLNLVLLFALVEEFLLYYLQRKDTSGIENRYFDLLLVPIAICIFSTVLELKSQKPLIFSRIARGIGLVLQGMWFLQMGLSFYTSLMAQGCSLHERSRGNYTIKCKGHPEYHRARAIATLQFNCLLAFIVALVVGVNSIVAQKRGIHGDFTNYQPLREEIQSFSNYCEFTLDSDYEGDDLANKKGGSGGAVEMSVHGYVSQH